MSSITVKPITTKSVEGDEIPWVPFAPYSDEVFLKYHHINPVQSEVLVSMRIPASMRLPVHYHTWIVIAHTIKGSWRYLEHDWLSRPGGTVYETAGSAHTPENCGEEEAEVFLVIAGELLFFDENGDVVARENDLTAMERYLAYCREHGIAPRDLSEY